MEPTDVQPTPVPRETPAGLQELLWLTRAYNQKEISFDEWLRLTRAWAEAIKRQYGATPPRKPAAPD